MKRSPLERRVGLARGPLNLGRRAPLARTAARRARPATQDATAPAEGRQERPESNTWPQDTRDAMQRRSGGWCEVCHAHPATDGHHRKRRREGDHRIVNALHVCRTCHNGIHANPAEARDNYGWIVSAWAKPEDTPVLINGNRWCLLTAEGGYRTDQRGWIS